MMSPGAIKPTVMGYVPGFAPQYLAIKNKRLIVYVCLIHLDTEYAHRVGV